MTKRVRLIYKYYYNKRCMNSKFPDQTAWCGYWHHLAFQSDSFLWFFQKSNHFILIPRSKMKQFFTLPLTRLLYYYYYRFSSEFRLWISNVPFSVIFLLQFILRIPWTTINNQKKIPKWLSPMSNPPFLCRFGLTVKRRKKNERYGWIWDGLVMRCAMK